MKFVQVKIRPVPSPSDKSGDKTLKGASRIYVSKEVLFELTGTALENGKPCYVEKILDDGQATTREASLWAAPDPNVKRGVALMSKPFQDACDLKLGDQVKVIYTDGKQVPAAEEVVLEDVTTGQPAIEKEDLVFWEWVLKGILVGMEDVCPGLLVKRVAEWGIVRNFKITSVNGSTSSNARVTASSTKIKISTGQDSETAAPVTRPTILKLDMIPGLEPQVRELNQKLHRWYKSHWGRRSCGLVLDGGAGTGKTILVEKICESGWGTVHRIRPQDKLSAITEKFQTARENQPSIVVIDGFESIINEDRSNRSAVIRTLMEFLEKLSSTPKTEAAKVIVLATCIDYTANIPLELRRVEYFSSHVHLPLPDPARRKEILASFRLPLAPGMEESILNDVSKKTHAYNGKDLEALAAQVCEMLDDELCNMDPGETISPDELFITEEMFTEAMKIVLPSAMNDIDLKPPPIHWDDIGGQEEVKRTLQRSVELTKMPMEELLQYMSNPPRGVLLYGPPGCSKTMAAQALATESDLNFFAVKGAELLNMYVGESERTVRQLFRRAREAAPSIIFMDEIDSIAGQRPGFGSTKSGGGGGGSSNGLNVLSTLLNEMQGFETLKGVLVVAATNRPQAIDPALLRPGRFDRHIFVGLPNEAARSSIFRKWLASKRCAEEIDVEELVRESEGCSGSETVNICDMAGSAALWRDGKEGPGVTMEDFRKQMNRPRMITPEMLEAFDVWRNKFLRKGSS